MSQARALMRGIIVGASLAAVGCSSPQRPLDSRITPSDAPQRDAGARPADAGVPMQAPTSPSVTTSPVLPPPAAPSQPMATPKKPADDSAEEVSQDNACGTGSVSAELTPVNMLVMFDRSGSMRDDGKWDSATAALTSFFRDPNAAGLRVALRFFPHDEPAAGCNNDACDQLACSMPLVSLGALQKEQAPMDAQEDHLLNAITAGAPGAGGGGNRGGGGTPIYAALDGALRWAAQQRSAHPAEKTVVIFVTDGEPNGCDEDFDHIAALASEALASSGVATYAIGLEGSSEDQMDQLAVAGGTKKGIFVSSGAGAEQELLTALNGIRSATISCDFAIPTPTNTMQKVDLNKLNVTVTRGNGSAATFRKVSDEVDCKNIGAWHYDATTDPQRIMLCPTACDAVQTDPSAKIEILIGCSTCGGLDESCREGTPPEVPPLF